VWTPDHVRGDKQKPYFNRFLVLSCGPFGKPDILTRLVAATKSRRGWPHPVPETT